MKAFVQGWINMSGPSSAKSGMQGNSDSHNGSNCIYDEVHIDTTLTPYTPHTVLITPIATLCR